MAQNDARGSYEKINYSLRPGKNIERKMICEVLGRLSVLENIKNYRYVGFGSAYFTDFALMHKTFGITDLISIEKDIENKARFDFNNPFSCVKIEYDDSNVVLPRLEWGSKKTILWLDYDDRLKSSMFNDIDTFFARAQPGSFFLISVNAEYDRVPSDLKDKSAKQYRLEKLAASVGESRIPLNARDKNLGADQYHNVVYEIIDREIKQLVLNRNAGRNSDDRVTYKQLFNLLYKDGALMLSIGGVLFNEAQQSRIDDMIFDNLEFVRTSSESFTIKVPNLTHREINALNNLLPNNIDSSTGNFLIDERQNLSIPALARNDVVDYSNIYRYFPTFAESNF